MVSGSPSRPLATTNLAPFSKIGVGVLGTDLHGAAVDGLFEPFGELDLGRAPALADDDLRGDVAPVDDGDFWP
jgi:hypothetical protein